MASRAWQSEMEMSERRSGVFGRIGAGGCGNREIGTRRCLFNRARKNYAASGDLQRHVSIVAIAGEGLYTRSTKLSTTFFSPAFSNAIVSLLPSIFTTLP